VHGIASAGDVKSAGSVGWRSIVYFEVVSTIVLAIDLVAGNLLQRGKAPMSVTVGALPASAAKAAPQGFTEFVMHIVPDNFIGAFTKGELLQVVVLAALVGIGLLAIRDSRFANAVAYAYSRRAPECRTRRPTRRRRWLMNVCALQRTAPLDTSRKRHPAERSPLRGPGTVTTFPLGLASLRARIPCHS